MGDMLIVNAETEGECRSPDSPYSALPLGVRNKAAGKFKRRHPSRRNICTSGSARGLPFRVCEEFTKRICATVIAPHA